MNVYVWVVPSLTVPVPVRLTVGATLAIVTGLGGGVAVGSVGVLDLDRHGCRCWRRRGRCSRSCRHRSCALNNGVADRVPVGAAVGRDDGEAVVAGVAGGEAVAVGGAFVDAQGVRASKGDGGGDVGDFDDVRRG